MTSDQVALLEWGERNRRDLPWRDTRDPWAVLVSEVMSQQTGVQRVVPKWSEFMQRWPTASAMADAPLSEVLVAWSGLGYPRRAKALRSTARLVVSDHGGRVPSDLEALLALPGVGAYTARAVLAFAFERDVGVLDTNVGRILARRTGRRLSPAHAQRLATESVPAGHGWAWNQSMLDLGATVCRPDPNCHICPFAAHCRWSGSPNEPDPALASAAVSRPQARYEGSARQARGRVLDAVGRRPLRAADLEHVVGEGHDASLIISSLASDGLVEVHPDGRIGLPRQ